MIPPLSVAAPVLMALIGNSDAAPSFPALAASVRADPPPEEITRGRHYVNSDERRHDLFLPEIEGRGGLYVGVGANQNYLLAGWARADAMIVIDFDQVIIDLHRVYAAALRGADSPEEFLRLWGPDRQARVDMRARIEEAYPPGPLRRAALKAYRAYRPNAAWGLLQMRERMRAQGVRTFQDDPEQYAALRRLVLEDRVLYVRGDFTGRRTLRDVTALAEELGWKVGVLYLSNIEQYFSWQEGRYRDNMLGLPLDASTVVLRAYGFGPRRAADHNYHYYVQTGASFRAWLKDAATRNVRRMLRASEDTGVKGFGRIDRRPEDPMPRRTPRSARSESRSGETGGSSGSGAAGG